MRRRSGFTLLELVLVLLLLGIFAGIAVPTFQKVKENAATRSLDTVLASIERNGEAIAVSDPDLSDAQVAAASVEGIVEDDGLTLDVSGTTVTATLVSGSLTLEGGVSFSGGEASVTPAGVPGPVSYAVGDVGPAGGIVFSTPDINGIGVYLEAAPADLASAVWCDLSLHGTNLPGSSGSLFGTGEQNTIDADASCTTGAIQAAADYSLNGFDDWFLPSLNELGTVYANRTLIGGFTAEPYWSSTEDNELYIWTVNFDGGGQNGTGKNSPQRLRVVRSFTP